MKKTKKTNKKIIIISLSIIFLISIFSLMTKVGAIPNYFDIDFLCSGESQSELNNEYNYEPGLFHGADKPVIYLYPEFEQKTSVRISYTGELTITYPKYNRGWSVLAHPDGTLTNIADNKEYSYLFWEGTDKDASYDLSEGFIVKGSEAVEFLQSSLSKLGLTPKEYNEFIVYWLPKMQNNKYNLVHFATKQEYDDRAKLDISPKPDSILRVFMVMKKVNSDQNIKTQQLESFKRRGFTVVEWGGTELN